MTVSFQCFLLVAIFSPFTFGWDNLNCGNKTKAKFWELCCDGDGYLLVEPVVFPEESCDVEPKNSTMTFADSAWLAYDCNVRKYLNSTDLTLQSYINLLLQARNASQSLLWETLKFQSNISEKIVSEEEYDKIQTIKLYHRESLQAIEESCTFADVNSTAQTRGFNPTFMDFKTRISMLQYSEECNNEMLPHFAYFAGNYNRDPNYANFLKCKQGLNVTLGNVTHFRFDGIISTLCYVIEQQHLDLITVQAQLKNHTLDFEDVVSRFLPGFWSKWVKNSVKNLIFSELKQEFKAQDLQNLETLMRNKVEESISQEFANGKWGTRLTNKRELVQAILILDIHDAFLKAADNVCRLDAYREDNAGVL